MTMTEDLRVRTAKLLHDAYEQVVHHSERQRRETWVAPKYQADMSTLNRELDRLFDETPEPPC
jgi:hypothetical protein